MAMDEKRLREYLVDSYEYDHNTGYFKVLKHSHAKKVGTNITLRNRGGYVIMTVAGKRYYAHRMAWLYIKWRLPKEHIDHIDGVRHNNAWSNLRECTQAENLWNKKTTTGRAKSVWYCKRRKAYVFFIAKNGQRKIIGKYSTYEEAVDASEIARRLCHGEFARTM